MVDLSRYPAGTVLLVKCYDGTIGHVVIQSQLSEDNIKLVRELGCVADLHPNGVVKKILGNTGDAAEWYNVVKIEAVLDCVKTTTIHNYPEPSQATPQLVDRVTLDGRGITVEPLSVPIELFHLLTATLIRELADSHKKLIEVVGKKFENYGA